MSGGAIIGMFLWIILIAAIVAVGLLSVELHSVRKVRDEAVRRVDNHRAAWNALDRLDPTIADAFNTYDGRQQREARAPYTVTRPRVDIMELRDYGVDLAFVAERKESKIRVDIAHDLLKQARKEQKEAKR